MYEANEAVTTFPTFSPNGIAYRNPINHPTARGAVQVRANGCGIFLDGKAVWAENTTRDEGFRLLDHPWTTVWAETACRRVVLCQLEDGGPLVVLDLRLN